MFSVIFPGQGSQLVGMGKEFFEKYDLVKKLFKEADDELGFPLSKIILEGPKEKLDLTENTQPAIFLISYSIFKVITSEFNIDLTKAKYFAGHSLGEYSALSCAKYLDFNKTIRILRIRGNAMQNSVPKGEGGMVAVLGSTVEIIEQVLEENDQNFKAQIANDNSVGQIVLSGQIKDLDKLIIILKEKLSLGFSEEVDLSSQKERILQKMESLKKQIDGLNNKLNNKAYIKNAPKEIVQNDKKLVKELTVEDEKLRSIVSSIN